MTAPSAVPGIQVRHRHHRHTGRTFTLITETVSFDDDVTVDLDIIRHPGAVAVVPMLGTDRVVLIEQYRHTLGGVIWEIPAGTLETGEAPLAAAQRELTEETGYVADHWEALGLLTPLPGYSDERLHLFMARNLIRTAQNLDPDERLTVHEMPLDVALAMIDDGRIHDGKTVATLLRVDRLLRK